MKDSGIIQWPETTITEQEIDEDATFCNWYIIVSPGFLIQLQWTLFDLVFSSDCAENYVEIKNDDKFLGK